MLSAEGRESRGLKEDERMKRVCDVCHCLMPDEKFAIRVKYLTWMDMGGDVYTFSSMDTDREMIVCERCYANRGKPYKHQQEVVTEDNNLFGLNGKNNYE